MTLIKIDSSLRSNPDAGPGDFLIQLPILISGQWDLQSCFICADFPNISASNNRIPFVENSISKVAIVPPGYYTNRTLTDAIETAMNVASEGYNNYTVSISSVTQKITISASNASFTLDWASRPQSSMASILGFPEQNSSNSSVVTGERFVVLNSVLSFNIIVEECQSIINAKGLATTFYVPMSSKVNPFGWNLFEPNGFQQRMFIKYPKRAFRIRVTDDNGRTLDLKQDWQMILKQVPMVSAALDV